MVYVVIWRNRGTV